MRKVIIARFHLFVTALLLSLIFGCALLPFRSTRCTDIAPDSTPSALTATAPGDSWVYQLQSAEPSTLQASGFDIVVMDYSADGSADGAYTETQLDTIRSSGGPQTILCYFSIGEAEDYRWYFDESWLRPVTGQPASDAPCRLGRTNPEWPGNYKVQYWSSDWHSVVLAYLDDIIDAGFDGVYLDIIDAYEYWADDENREGFTITEREAVDRMINLVLTIANHARESDPEFLIFPQNGEGILAYDDGGGTFVADAYLDSISGIGIEDLYYDGTDERETAETSARIVWLDKIKDEGKVVIVVDYVDDGSGSTSNADRIADFRSKAVADGYIPYAAREDRELDTINSMEHGS